MMGVPGPRLQEAASPLAGRRNTLPLPAGTTVGVGDTPSRFIVPGMFLTLSLIFPGLDRSAHLVVSSIARQSPSSVGGV